MSSARDVRVFLTVLVWVPLVLGIDQSTTRGTQPLLGAATWLLLLWLLRSEDRLTRIQVGVVVAFASLVEYTFSAGLHVYVYRLGGVPTFVPPGHGLIYLGALALGRSAWLTARHRFAVMLTLAAAGLYGLYGVSPLAPRLDVLGAFWACCLALFLWRGRSPLTFVGAFLLVSWLEIIGTRLGSWTWAAYSPTGLVAQGNPPTGAAGGYGFFDAAALFAAPWLSQLLDRISGRLPAVGAGAGIGERDLVEPVGGAAEPHGRGVVAEHAVDAVGQAGVGVHDGGAGGSGRVPAAPRRVLEPQAPVGAGQHDG